MVVGIGKAAAPSSLTWMPHARRHGNAHCPVIQLCLLLDADSTAVCASGYTLAKARGGGTYAHHSSQRCRPANGSARMWAEAMATIKVNSARALRAITTYLRLFVLTTQVALVRLDEQYGDTVAIAQLIGAGVHLVTRARGYPRPGAPIRSNACWLTHQPRG